MSVLTPERVFSRVAVTVATLLIATTVWGANPSPRTLARMAFDEKDRVGILFGGRGHRDNSTTLYHDTNETWLWIGRWVQLFPAHSPSARAAHSMTWDSTHDRMVVFGGRVESSDPRNQTPSLLNDTWVWENDDWTQIVTADAPSQRHFAGMAYDPVRDRVVLYGGTILTATGLEPIYDTWEFDGTNWTKIESAAATKVAKPLMVWDKARREILMVGMDGNTTDTSTVTYSYRPATGTWEQRTSEKKPGCVNEGGIAYQDSNNTVLVSGGVCSLSTPTTAETWEWNGSKWTEITTNSTSRIIGEAMTYDSARDRVVFFGGTLAFTTIPRSVTTVYRDKKWSFSLASVGPSPRSLFGFATDPDRNTIWMYGGLEENRGGYLGDLWSYSNGQWGRVVVPTEDDKGPGACATPLAAFDTNRKVLIVVCGGSDVFEFDGAEWKAPTPKNAPSPRSFANMVYDQQLKKVVLFGGYDGSAYRSDTWLWDGTTWTEVKKDRPPRRVSFSMWYDPLAKKTIVFGGYGRSDYDTEIVRFNDMYSFDGNGWTKMNVSSTPGGRFNAIVGVQPSGKVLLFGGIRWEQVDPENKDDIRQTYENDIWSWDGAANTWTKLESGEVRPEVRVNGGLAYDPVAQRMTLFGGYSRGFFYSDVWTWDGQTWTPRPESIGRRRSVGQ